MPVSSADQPSDESEQRSVQEVAANYFEVIREDSEQANRIAELRSNHEGGSAFLDRIDRGIEELQAEVEAEKVKQQEEMRLKDELLERSEAFELAEG